MVFLNAFAAPSKFALIPAFSFGRQRTPGARKGAFVRFGSALFVALASGSTFAAEAASKTHIECAMTTKCHAGSCTDMKPAPILLRYVKMNEKLIIVSYAAADLIGGPVADPGHGALFGWSIPEGVAGVFPDGEHGVSNDGNIWINVLTPDKQPQQLLISAQVERSEGGLDISPAQLVPGRSSAITERVENGFAGECRWHLKMSKSNAKTEENSAND